MGSVGRNIVRLGTQLVGNDRTHRRVLNRAAGIAAGVHQVRSGAVLANDVVTDGTQDDRAVHQLGCARHVLTDTHAGDRRRDGVVVGARLEVACGLDLGVERVDVARAASQPEEDAGIGFADDEASAGGPSGGLGSLRREPSLLEGCVSEITFPTKSVRPRDGRHWARGPHAKIHWGLANHSEPFTLEVSPHELALVSLRTVKVHRRGITVVPHCRAAACRDSNIFGRGSLFRAG